MMFLSAAVATSFLAFLQGTAATTSNRHYSDELIAAMVKTAQDQLSATLATSALTTGIDHAFRSLVI
jgi:hypothetical protein